MEKENWGVDWRIFENFSQETNDVCPICGTNESKPCGLIAKQGTLDDGIVEAIQVHMDCLNPKWFWYNKELGLIFVSASFGK